MFNKLMTAIVMIYTTVLFIQGTAFALDPSSHMAINLHIANSTMNGFSLDQYLKSNLDFSQGIGEQFDGRRVDIWLELGGRYEDIPPWDIPDSWGIPYLRSFNHFHNPINEQGLSGSLGTGMSSTEWALKPKNTQSSSCLLSCGSYSWHDVRDYYHKALTESDQNNRNINFKKTFRGLGQLMHLIQDASVPAHTRNDFHFYYNYEKWVKALTDFSIYNAVFFSNTINDIASFIDTDQYNETNPIITDGTNIGLSEYANANFFSNDTNAIESTSFTYPQIKENTDIVEIVYINNNVPLADTKERQYYKKNYDGETYGVDGTGYLLSGVDYFEYYRKSLNPLGAQKLIAPLLDYNVYEDYAFLLLPRAIGYSAGLLNYFFRGEIEVDLIDAESLTITNSSAETMDGTFTLYYDAADGNRKLVSGVSWSSLPPLYAGDTSDELSFTEPTDIDEDKQYTLVFEGTLGSESNAVVGKVFSGAGCLDSAKFSIDSVVGKTVTITPDINLCLNHFFVDWGDNQYNIHTLTHTYERAGTYNIKLTAYDPNYAEGISTAEVVQEFETLGARYVPFTFISLADSYDQLVNDPPFNEWIPEDGWSSSTQWWARYSIDFPIWSIRYSRSRFIVKLSDIASVPSVLSGKCFIYLTGTYLSYVSYDDDGGSYPIVESYGGSDMGLTAFESFDIPYYSSIASMVDKTVPMVDSIAGLWDSKGSGDPPPIMPKPEDQSTVYPNNTKRTGWDMGNADFQQRGLIYNSEAVRKVWVRPYLYKKELTKEVTVVF